MKNILSFCFLLSSVCAFSGDGKNDALPISSVAPLVEDGNKLLSIGQFSAAMAVWKKVLESDPHNANANFKMGMCWYNSIDESPKALPYLKKASKKITDKYDFFSASEKNAPYDVLYFLGETYLAADQPDSALWIFFQYEDKFGGNPPIPVDRQIRNCINAKNSKKNPRDVSMKNPGKNVNSTFAETNPVLTIDNSVMFFASRRAPKEGNKQISNVTGKYDQDIYFTRKDAAGKWEAAIPFKWNTDKDETPLYISADGLTLYFSKIVNGQSDIFTSSYVDKVWGAPKPVSEINSSDNETGVSVSSDGKYLYFSSDRNGGNGKFDIYQCMRSGKKWGTPKNLGTALNTSFSEISPYINPNGKTLFFASNGYRDGMGGYDIFFSELKDNGTWSTPQNMGFPINTTRDDINYYITGGGTRYYATVREDADSYDIFKIEGGGLSIENIDATGQVVTLTQEMSVSDVVEVQKTVEKEVEVVETVETTVEVIKEVEKVDVEKEKAKMDSMMTLARKEAGLDKMKFESAKAQAKADSIKAVAAIKIAEADKAKANAEAKKADADKSKADAARSASDAAKAKSDAVIAAAQKAKDDAAAAKAKADAKTADANKAKADAATAQAEATKVKAEADKATSTAAAAAAVTAKVAAEQKNNELKIQLAEAEKPKNEALKAQAEAAKAKAEADKLKAQEAIAAAAKSKTDAVIAAADKAKADAEKAKAQADIANASKAQADAAKVDAIAKTTQANADKSKADAEKAKAQADIANADKAKAEAAKAEAATKTAQASADKAKADADVKKADADKLKAQTDIANLAKAKIDSAKVLAVAKTTQATADKAKADAEKAKADAEIKKADAEKLKAQADIAAAEKAKADAAKAEALAAKAKADAEKAKADAEAKKAQAEILKAQPVKTPSNPAQKTGGK